MQKEVPDYLLLTSTRYDPYLETLNWNNDHEGPSSLFLLPCHFDRLNAASKSHNWLNARFSLIYSELKASCINAVLEEGSKESNSGAYKIRITLSKNGQIAVTAAPLPTCFESEPMLASLFTPFDWPSSLLHKLPLVTVFLDKQPSRPSIFTQTKTTFRQVYEEAKERNQDVLSSGAAGSDVLLYNLEEQIMETTIFNIALYRSGKWLTPTIPSGCLSGVIRRWLLEHGNIHDDAQGILTKTGVQEGELVLLFNGVQGCRLGRIHK